MTNLTDTAQFQKVLNTVVWPLLGIGLVAAGVYLIFIAKASGDGTGDDSRYLILFAMMIVVGLGMVSFDKARTVRDFVLESVKSFKSTLVEPAKPEPEKVNGDAEIVKQGVKSEDAPPPEPDEWNRLLRPVLYQASQYTVPTYYLNANLQIIDWNVAFELVFREILGKIRNKHVNYFINELANKNQVFDHAREFTRKVREGYLALVDIEPLTWRSSKYGTVTFVKVAALLNDGQGDEQGWSVALMPREIDWAPFQRDLFDKVREDKLWSVYSVSYDRVLLRFPPYSKLIDDVIAVVPEGGRSVLDLGAGTGNVTAALLRGDNRVTAVESNLAMLEKLRERRFNPLAVTIVKASADSLESLDPRLDGTFDAAVMVNVLYALDQPLDCLQNVFRLLRPGGVLGFSTTTKETRIDPLLDSIRAHLKQTNQFDRLELDYERLYGANKDIEKTIAHRYTAEQYRQWVKTAGFQITKDVPSTYEGAVMLMHAVKPA